MSAAAAPSLGPCPHCGQPHPEDVLVCPKESKVMPLEGRLLDGKFKFSKLLGAGGMGAVWKAHNIRVKKSVAIKLMHPEFAGNPGILDRFRQEATAAGEIGSQHICDIYDFGPSVLGPYIVLEMLNGRSLGELISQYGRVDPGLVAIVVRQALEGLEAAHKVGIVHRDLKPENIFLHEPTPGRLLVKLMDFGISKFSMGDGAGKTSAGVLMGTPEYMSPEQSEGAASVDARTDIWAMGAIIYKALTGVEAFAGATMAATLVAVSTREPRPITEYAPSCPPELIAVVARCLRKDPAGRYATARELSDALAPFEQLTAALPPPPIAPTSGGFATSAGMTSGPSPVAPQQSGGTLVTRGNPTAGPPQQATMITGQAPPRPAAQAGTFVGNPMTNNVAPDDSWSIGAQAPIESRPPSTLSGSPTSPGSSGGSGKLVVSLIVLLLVAAVIAVAVFMRTPGGKRNPDEPRPTVVATTPPDTKVTTPDPIPGTTAGTVTPDPIPGTTAGTVTPDPIPGTTAGTVTPPDPTPDKPVETKHNTPAPKPKPDMAAVIVEGSLYAPKQASPSTLKSQKEALSYCAGLKKAKLGNLAGWTLATVAEALKFKERAEVNKRMYWTRDAVSGGRVKQVQLIGGRTFERVESDDRQTGSALCVAKN